MRNFRELKIWQRGMDLVADVYELSKMLPVDERFGLKSQMSRAVVSIPSNIAEGSARRSEKDYRRFVEISLGSAFELETQLLLIQRMGLVDSDKMKSILSELEEQQKMMVGFMSKLKA